MVLQLKMTNGIEFDVYLDNCTTLEEAYAEFATMTHVLAERRGSKHIVNLWQMVSASELEPKTSGK